MLIGPLSEKLRMFDFPAFPSLPSTTAARTTNLFNGRMAVLTPKNISHPQAKTETSQHDQNSHETKIRKGEFKPDDSRDIGSGSEYRDIQATSPSTLNKAGDGKKRPKYPAAPLPFLVNKSVESARNDTLSLETSPTLAETSFTAESPPAFPNKHQPLPQGHAPPTMELNTPSLITTEVSPSAPSSFQSIKAPLANATDNEPDYRPTSRESCLSDQEADVHNQSATESDLETHAGDDDFNYSIDPEEDEDYDSLQSHFKNMRIGSVNVTMLIIQRMRLGKRRILLI